MTRRTAYTVSVLIVWAAVLLIYGAGPLLLAAALMHMRQIGY